MSAINANTQIYNSIMNRTALLHLYERRVSNKVFLILDNHKIRVDTLIKEAKLSDKGFKRLQEAIDQELLRTHQETFNTSKRSLLDLATDQASYIYQNMEVAVGHIWKVKRPQSRVAEEIVLERPLYKNKTLESSWEGISLQEKKRLEKVIRYGIANDKTADEIALEVRKGHIHDITRNQSKALVVTAITSVHNQVDHQIYQANAKAIIGYQYVAVLDSRTTQLCAHLDGQIFPIGDYEHVPPLVI